MKMLPNVITTCTRSWLGRLTLLAGAVAGVLACEEPKEIGLTPTTPVTVSYTDTLTVTRETIRFDSVRSNDQSTMLVGRYTDPIFGRVQTRSFVQLSLGSNFVVTDSATTNVTPASRIVCDSTRLFLDYDQLYYGDTTQTQELQIYRLTDSLNTTINYDISSNVPAETQPLIRQTIRPRPNTTDSLSFKLTVPDAFGRELMALANTEAGKTTNPALFRAQVRRGLMLTTASSNQAAVIGFSTGSAVVVYYHVEGERRVRFQIFSLAGKRFNQITADRSGTALANLQRGQVLPASATNERTFIQPGTGVTTRLTFPTLIRFVQQARVAINRADLIITPTRSTNDNIYAPYLMSLAELDEKNVLRRTDVTGSGTSRFGGFPFIVPATGPTDRTAISFARPQQVELRDRTRDYTFDMTGYLQSIVIGITPNTGLALVAPGGTLFPQNANGGVSDATQAFLTDRVWRAALDGKSSVKLVVFYTTSN